jgi:hypothetical protein
MPNNLTDDPTQFPSPVQAPAPSDPRTDTSVATPFQQLSNRTANTKARFDAIDPFSAPGYTPALPTGVIPGACNVLQCANLAQLASIPVANRTAGMLCLVTGLEQLYQYTSATIAPVANTVVTPTDTIGSWLALGYGLANQPNGFAQADSTGRTPAASVRNGIVTFASVTPGNQSPGTAGFATWSGASIALTLAIGDVVFLCYSFAVQVPVAPTSSSYYANSQVQVVLPSTVTTAVVNSGQQFYGIPIQGTSIFQAVSSSQVFTATAAGVHTFNLQTSQTTGGNAVAYTQGNLMAAQFRP